MLAAEAMGADLAYIGTRFVATEEAMAAAAHKDMILKTRATDVFLTASIDGAPANWLTPIAARRRHRPRRAAHHLARQDRRRRQENKKRWKDIYTAGHGVGNIEDVPDAAELCRRLIAQYQEAKKNMPRNLRMNKTKEAKDLADIEAGLQEAKQGEFASPEEVAATIAKYTKLPRRRPRRRDSSRPPRETKGPGAVGTARAKGPRSGRTMS